MTPSMRWLPWSELGLILIEHPRSQQAKSAAADWDFFRHGSGVQRFHSSLFTLHPLRWVGLLVNLSEALESDVGVNLSRVEMFVT